jgi:hypothetical protein
MIKKPPHLPNQACRVDTYHRLQSIKWLLLFAFLAFVAGASASVMVSSWFLPQYEAVQFVERVGSNNQIIFTNIPNSLTKKQTEQRLMNIYDKRKKTGEYYLVDSFVARAAIVSSDGWLVSYMPDYTLSKEKNWEVISYQDISYDIEKSVYDSVNSLLYLKVSAESLRVIDFPAWQNINLGTHVWSLNLGEWQENIIKNFIISSSNSTKIDKADYSFGFVEPVLVGSIIVGDNGQLIGFADEHNNLFPSWGIEKNLTLLLDNGKIKNNLLSWQGDFVYGDFDEGNAKNDFGFYVKYSDDRVTTSTVGAGDVILEVDGQAVDKFRLAEQIWLAGDQFLVVVWRDEKRIVIEVDKQ